MKKKVVLALIIALFLSALVGVIAVRTNNHPNYFRDNVEVLADDEVPKGHCMENVNLCMIECPNPQCHVHFISDPEKPGPAYNVSGVCPVCHQYFHID